jgi:peptidoglycan/xylan/chitin deacetylase (PgdA/CDA1 family)
MHYLNGVFNVDSGDSSCKKKSKEEILEQVLKNVYKNKTSIILFHDSPGKESSVEALPEIIDTLLNEGYTFMPIDEYSFTIHFSGQ